MKINKDKFVLRLITIPFKLLFTLIWMIVYGCMLSWRWLLYGSAEFYFGKDFGKGELVQIIEKLEKITDIKYKTDEK